MQAPSQPQPPTHPPTPQQNTRTRPRAAHLRAPDTTRYSAFLGSVCTSTACWQQGVFMRKLQILVLW